MSVNDIFKWFISITGIDSESFKYSQSIVQQGKVLISVMISSKSLLYELTWYLDQSLEL